MSSTCFSLDGLLFPPEVLFQILSYLGFEDVLSLSVLNTTLNRFFHLDGMWRIAFVARYRAAPYRIVANWKMEYYRTEQLREHIRSSSAKPSALFVDEKMRNDRHHERRWIKQLYISDNLEWTYYTFFSDEMARANRRRGGEGENGENGENENENEQVVGFRQQPAEMEPFPRETSQVTCFQLSTQSRVPLRSLLDYSLGFHTCTRDYLVAHENETWNIYKLSFPRHSSTSSGSSPSSKSQPKSQISLSKLYSIQSREKLIWVATYDERWVFFKSEFTLCLYIYDLYKLTMIFKTHAASSHGIYRPLQYQPYVLAVLGDKVELQPNSATVEASGLSSCMVTDSRRTFPLSPIHVKDAASAEHVPLVINTVSVYASQHMEAFLVSLDDRTVQLLLLTFENGMPQATFLVLYQMSALVLKSAPFAMMDLSHRLKRREECVEDLTFALYTVDLEETRVHIWRSKRPTHEALKLKDHDFHHIIVRVNDPSDLFSFHFDSEKLVLFQHSGRVRVYCSYTRQLLKVIKLWKSSKPFYAPDAFLCSVQDWTLCVAENDTGQFKIYDLIDRHRQKGDKRKSSSQSIAAAEKMSIKKEIRGSLLDWQEDKDRQSQLELQCLSLNGSDRRLVGLTEQELLDYAMILSMEETLSGGPSPSLP